MNQALALLKQKYQHTLMLSIEEVDEKYDNYSQRVKRREFERIHETKAVPLKRLSNGKHYHTIEAESEEILDLIKEISKAETEWVKAPQET